MDCTSYYDEVPFAFVLANQSLLLVDEFVQSLASYPDFAYLG